MQIFVKVCLLASSSKPHRPTPWYRFAPVNRHASAVAGSAVAGLSSWSPLACRKWGASASIEIPTRRRPYCATTNH
ncbi:hypothetical protein BCR44DRAFT_40043 [Catenaria anguillulae PL171]|uniref:Uncharacterized protein n=1 Tax=Catenaria anguillulae PL171 TaxID=765915 RepID=A0A1Y2I0V2_9FUNG|nr:hypothetical protein BCR44DRAFT_40043 [Catenaria anguillulae PL171]